jgi:hypothetical protein
LTGTVIVGKRRDNRPASIKLRQYRSSTSSEVQGGALAPLYYELMFENLLKANYNNSTETKPNFFWFLQF